MIYVNTVNIELEPIAVRSSAAITLARNSTRISAFAPLRPGAARMGSVNRNAAIAITPSADMLQNDVRQPSCVPVQVAGGTQMNWRSSAP